METVIRVFEWTDRVVRDALDSMTRDERAFFDCPTGEIAVVGSDGFGVVGLGVLGRRLFRGEWIPVIDAVWVHPAARRNRIGIRLLAALVAESQRRFGSVSPAIVGGSEEGESLIDAALRAGISLATLE